MAESTLQDYSAEAIPPLTDPTVSQRMSIRPIFRIPTAIGTGFVVGLMLGTSHGGKTAALRFRAENAHRLPTSTKGWYLYHKSKNYHAALDGVKEGLKMGSKIGVWVGGFFYLESSIDLCRGGRKDFLSTTMAGLTVAGAFSVWSQSTSECLNLADSSKIGCLWQQARES